MARRDASTSLSRPRRSHGASLHSTCSGSSQAAVRWARVPPRMPTGTRFARQGARRTTTHGACDKERATQSGGKLSKANATRPGPRQIRADSDPASHGLPREASACGLSGAVPRTRRAAPEGSWPPRGEPACGLSGAVTSKRSCGCHAAAAKCGQGFPGRGRAVAVSEGACIAGHHCSARRSRTSRDAARPIRAAGDVSRTARSVSSTPMLASAARTDCRTLVTS